MKYSRFCRFLSLGIILALLVLLSTVPVPAASAIITLNPYSGRISDWVDINGVGFDANKAVFICFSSDEAEVDDTLDVKVTAYQGVTVTSTDAVGDLTPSWFFVPEALTQGSAEEDVHCGDYYVYATYIGSKTIVAVAGFTVIGAEIELDPEEGTVGTTVGISGEGLRKNQQITVEYDGDEIDIISGDAETDSYGEFACAIVIPESVFGSHTITVIDESGNRPEAEFKVKPKITPDPAEQAIGEVVTVYGTGFAKREVINLTLDGQWLDITPVSITTNHLGSFTCSFVVPFFNNWGVRGIRASGVQSLNSAEAQLTILTSIALSPVTSSASPGHVSMELTVYGSRFIANSMITITYAINDNEVIIVAEAMADGNGNLSTKFTVPASVAGSHVAVATDGTTSVTSVFIMESQAPTVPHLLLPEVAGTSPAEVYFDWEDVADPSGVSYVLQVAADANFTTIVLERGAATSEYAVGEEEKLAPTEAGVPYYWRVKAVDGASNEGDWSFPRLFRVSPSGISLLGWVWYALCGFGVLLLIIVGFWRREWRRR